MWETPTPSRAELESRVIRSSIATIDTYTRDLPLYCTMTKEKSAACDEFNFGSYDGGGIIYQRDQYWNKSATLPSDASVLLLGGKLDVLTPPKYAGYLLEALGTSKKELIVFDYAGHDVVFSSGMGNGSDPVLTCGFQLVMSYIKNDGDLQRLNRTCVSEMSPFDFSVPTYELHNLLHTDEAYDGEYKPELGST
ncbi:hypothetical protein PHYSODRAFT_526044 [Phytophthora sojae]|uniref:Peptidase S33 tripeptidyl aminopeptidase-like C-terminal domain-containing protein n=1 Tax=Phytophthora sojae (strain P6497) TaxID=1094619 RepID=G5A8Q0_PHYSP|nr:hypothetical protein PHYSODRAFT_526044 [Phytophthora sojae]EGZ08276.1 hypothetical protein PHYSODRAFT_526044 [Phytophthora sojae]|eukprot:XP_009536448.1 hypothetical protein PHYSODRAFT_526044 [Phytophthora sojae]